MVNLLIFRLTTYCNWDDKNVTVINFPDLIAILKRKYIVKKKNKTNNCHLAAAAAAADST